MVCYFEAILSENYTNKKEKEVILLLNSGSEFKKPQCSIICVSFFNVANFFKFNLKICKLKDSICVRQIEWTTSDSIYC